MGCIFILYSNIVLKLLFIFTAVTSASSVSQIESAELLQESNGQNSPELLASRSDESIAELSNEPNDVEETVEPNGKNSAEIINRPQKDDSGEQNCENSAELQKEPKDGSLTMSENENMGSDETDYVELNLEDKLNTNDLSQEKRYQEELSHGNKAESYGNNPHYYQPDKYLDLSRRFASRYSSEEDEDVILVKEDTYKRNLEPKLASPDLVLAVAKESAILEAGRSRDPSEYIIEKNALRSGNYWNYIWKEDINPTTVLRSNPKKPLGVITAKINPGSNLYDLVTKLRQFSPTLLYVNNKKIKY